MLSKKTGAEVPALGVEEPHERQVLEEVMIVIVKEVEELQAQGEAKTEINERETAAETIMTGIHGTQVPRRGDQVLVRD